MWQRKQNKNRIIKSVQLAGLLEATNIQIDSFSYVSNS